jgi:RNA polymerase sigma-54 factor
MKPTLQLRFTQQLALTPQLQQSIRLLQLSTLELNQELEQALSDNPLLERLDDALDHALRIAPNGGLDSGPPPGAGTAPGAGEASGGEEPGGEGAEGGDDGARGEGLDWSDAGEWGDGSARSRGEGDAADAERDYAQVAAVGTSLREHLDAQLRATQCGPIDRGLLTLMIDEVDADGYLRIGLDELMAMLPEELDIEPEAVGAALKLLQSFDPAGVGARDLAECLTLQLADPGVASRASAATVDLARSIVRDHLALLAARDFARLKRMLRCADDDLRAAHKLITSLNPRPGGAYAPEAPNYVVPDVLVRKTRAGWQASLNPDVMPKLRINAMYAQILKRNRGGNAGLSGQLQEARWLIKNVQQRFDTILRVSQAIVDRQRAFFSHGAVAMRPLVLREIADAIGLHESTVSRVTTQKFMLTPFGTFELKYFFGSHVATDTGGAASSTAIRELIKQLIHSEDAKSPLSDSQIAELLGEQGIMVARRTVAKYREGLRIPAVTQRKAL